MNNDSDRYNISDPEFQLLLKRAYNVDSEDEKKKTFKILDDDPKNKDIYDGIIIVKENEGFESIEEHLQLIRKDKKRLRDFYTEFKKQKKNKKQSVIRLISYTSAAAIITFLITLGIFKLILQQPNLDQYVSKKEHELLQEEMDSIRQLVSNNQDIYDFSLKQKKTIDSLNQSLFAYKEQVKVLNSTGGAFDLIAIYQELARQKGYDDPQNLFSMPDTTGVYAGGEDELDVVLLSPKDLKAHFLSTPLEFKWNTGLSGSATLQCYVAKTLGDGFDGKSIELKEGEVEIPVSELQPGVYFWVITQGKTKSERQYFVLLP
ncbi:MAG: hypothetical protein R2764_08280 [Bacteroidales bacterium]